MRIRMSNSKNIFYNFFFYVLILLLLLLNFPAESKKKYLDPNYTFKQWEKVKWPEDTGLLKRTYEIVGNQPDKPYNHAWVNDLVRDGEYAIRLEIRDRECGRDDCPRGDFTGWAGRTEFGFWDTNITGENWFRWSVYIPKETMELQSKGWTLFTQIKANYKSQKNKDCPIIPLYLMLDDQGINLGKEKGDCDQFFLQIIPNEENFKGKWLDFIAHTKWSKKDDGFIHLWVNGKKEYTYTGSTVSILNNNYPPVFRLPIYNGNRDKNEKITQVMYFDSFYAAKKCEKMKLENIGYSCDNLEK